MDKIYLSGMQFYGYHGVFAEENKLGQRFRADLTVERDLRKAGETDQLEHTVNYGELYKICREVIEGEPKKLIESLAETIAADILKGFPEVHSVTVKLIKPDPPIPGHYEYAAVEITRHR
ncbi:dihydroneopterin aldolase [Bacillus mangrovi]|uniref:7,8-dihydroneopterin aldolase n=1 Tax=Metabacillus mangrovi TaxID=1491830 RepID=A0A7X2V5W2_9BACI|nr:dihydroneopterin aldolase [Metabacillus mangrovi]